jgi:hypothetical protein
VSRPPPLAVAGTGGLHLQRMKDKKWARSLLHLVRAHDQGKIPGLTVADFLAEPNYRVSLTISDNSVGPRCIVAWQNKDEVSRKRGGGIQFYTGTTRDSFFGGLPIIGTGMDVRALLDFSRKHYAPTFEAMRAGQTPREMTKEEIDAELAKIPHTPDEKLR